MNQMIGVVDEPIDPSSRKNDKDNLDIEIHSKSLIEFIQHSKTPITVGIQGEWGSGKTSLLNMIHHAYDSEPTFKQIWINSWEYSLLSTPEEALIKIINKIIEDLLEGNKNEKVKKLIKRGAETIFLGALRIGAQVSMGTGDKVTKEIMGSSDHTITSLRKQIIKLVKDISQLQEPIKKIIVYVDDLDRIEPKNAVEILELLKNIFSIPNCVFILAIDYQVVVKGLEHKFGKKTYENEWEYKAFFDKIIQLPFRMPMGQYDIGNYVNTLLNDIGFIKGYGLEDVAIREILQFTIRGNPRSIKRLVNSISLIQIFVKNKKLLSHENNDDQDKVIINEKDEKDEKFLIFSLVCLQIAYPHIYSLLIQQPDFTKWDDQLALKYTKRSEKLNEAFQKEFDLAQDSEDFEEDWEKFLFKICYEQPTLKPRVTDISQFFSYIKDYLFNNNQEIIGRTIADILSKTSVTSVSSKDQDQSSEFSKRKNVKYRKRIKEVYDKLTFEEDYKKDYLKDKIFQQIKDITGIKPHPQTLNIQLGNAIVNEKSREHNVIKNHGYDLFYYLDENAKDKVIKKYDVNNPPPAIKIYYKDNIIS